MQGKFYPQPLKLSKVFSKTIFVLLLTFAGLTSFAQNFCASEIVRFKEDFGTGTAFTPNGDGYNDTWQIKFSNAEPKLNVDIFDRYGKFIIRLKGGEVGWDGTYNGHELFSTDYWFVVTREDGKVYRGHFSLKR